MELALKIRNILFKCFLIALILMIIGHLLFVMNSSFAVKIFHSVYGINEESARLSIVFAFNAMKIISVMFFLIPAAAIHCEFLKCGCKLSKKDE